MERICREPTPSLPWHDVAPHILSLYMKPLKNELNELLGNLISKVVNADITDQTTTSEDLKAGYVRRLICTQVRSDYWKLHDEIVDHTNLMNEKALCWAKVSKAWRMSLKWDPRGLCMWVRSMWKVGKEGDEVYEIPKGLIVYKGHDEFIWRRVERKSFLFREGYVSNSATGAQVMTPVSSSVSESSDVSESSEDEWDNLFTEEIFAVDY